MSAYPFRDHRTVVEIDAARKALSIRAAEALPTPADPHAAAFAYHSERLTKALARTNETLAVMAVEQQRWADLQAAWDAMTPAEASAFVQSGEYAAFMAVLPAMRNPS